MTVSWHHVSCGATSAAAMLICARKLMRVRRARCWRCWRCLQLPDGPSAYTQVTRQECHPLARDQLPQADRRRATKSPLAKARLAPLARHPSSAAHRRGLARTRRLRPMMAMMMAASTSMPRWIPCCLPSATCCRWIRLMRFSTSRTPSARCCLPLAQLSTSPFSPPAGGACPPAS